MSDGCVNNTQKLPKRSLGESAWRVVHTRAKSSSLLCSCFFSLFRAPDKTAAEGKTRRRHKPSDTDIRVSPAAPRWRRNWSAETVIPTASTHTVPYAPPVAPPSFSPVEIERQRYHFYLFVRFYARAFFFFFR